MKKAFLKFNILIVLICILFLITGCKAYKGYQGENPELLTVALNNLLGANGYFSDGEAIADPQIKILEEDSFGRVLFAYSELSDLSSISLLIMQNKDDNFVYYYPDYCFINSYVFSTEYYALFTVFEDFLDYSFKGEEIDNFKVLNDWNKELDNEKFIKKEIIRKKVQPKVDEKLFNKLYDIAIESESSKTTYRYRYSNLLTSDDYGRMIFLVVGITDYNYWEYYVFILNPDWTYDENNFQMKLTNSYNYQDSLKELKKLNDWNIPI